MDPQLPRRVGVGNPTCLGVAPFIVNQPILLNNWIAAREEGVARVRAHGTVTARTVAGFRAALAAAQRNAEVWTSKHPVQQATLAALRADLAAIAARADDIAFAGEARWDRLWRWGEETLSPEGQDALLALLIEPHGAPVHDLAATRAADEEAAFHIDGAMWIRWRAAIRRDRYDQTLATDYTRPRNCARFR